MKNRKMLKKILFILSCNILILISCLILLEILGYYSNLNSIDYKITSEEKPPYPFIMHSDDEFYKYWKTEIKREPYLMDENGKAYTGRPIVIFGCSLAYGLYLNNNQTFGYKLANKMHRPVYILAIPGGSPAHMLYQLQNDSSIFKEIKDPEFIIWVGSSCHKDRLYYHFYGNAPSQYCYIAYELKNNQLKQLKRNHWYNKFWNLQILQIYFRKIQEERKAIKDDSYELLKRIFLESRNIIKEHWKNSTFIILNIRDWDAADCNDPYYYNRIWDELDNGLDIRVFDMINLTQENICQLSYTLKGEGLIDDLHPNERFWDTIIDSFSDAITAN